MDSSSKVVAALLVALAPVAAYAWDASAPSGRTQSLAEARRQLPDMKPGRYRETIKLVDSNNLPPDAQAVFEGESEKVREFCYSQTLPGSSKKRNILDRRLDDCTLTNALRSGKTTTITALCKDPTGGFTLAGEFQPARANFRMSAWMEENPRAGRGRAEIDIEWERLGACGS